MSPPSKEDFRRWKYWHAVTVLGKLVMVIILVAYSEGKINATHTYRDELLNYFVLRSHRKKSTKTPEKEYENEFKKEVRQKLENPGVDPYVFDITLCVQLLKRLHGITGLAFDYEDVWFKDDPPGSIEFLIYRLKFHRNIVSHETPVLDETELENTLNELETLYTELLEKVLTDKGKSRVEIDREKNRIQKDFKDLKDPIFETLTKKDIDAYYKKQKYYQQISTDETIREVLSILCEDYQDTCYTNPAEWMDLDEDYDLETDTVFTQIEIVEEDKSLHDKSSTPNRICDYRTILEETTKKGKDPRLITLIGNGGLGKTTLIRLFVRMWNINKNFISGLLKYPILFFVQLRSTSEKNFDELIRNRLAKVMTRNALSFEMLKQIILSVNCLIILDGQDESPHDDLLHNILNLANSLKTMKLLITSRPSHYGPLKDIVNSFSFPKLDLKLIGIAIEDQVEFITKYVKAMEKDSVRQTDIMLMVNENLPDLNSRLGDMMRSPLILSLLALLWVSGKFKGALTVTEIFQEVNDILKGKLISRIRKRINVSNLEEKLDMFLKFLQSIAFLQFSRKEISFKEETHELLRAKIRECGLEEVETEIMGHYLQCNKYRKNSRIAVYYAYKHLRLQEHDASTHVCHILSTGSKKDKNSILDQLKEDRFSNIRAHTIAMLADNDRDPKLLKQYGKVITEGVKGHRQEDNLLNLVMESKSNKTVVSMVSTIMKAKDTWTIWNISSLAPLIDALKITQPKSLYLWFSHLSKLPALTDNYLRTIASYKLNLNIRLPHTPVDPDGSKPAETHEDILTSVTDSTTSATLTLFHGRLGSDGFQQLPTSLTHLWICISTKDLQDLFCTVTKLINLQFLAISFWCCDLDGVATLPRLSTSARRIRLSSRGARDEDCQHIATLAQRCDNGTGVETLWLGNSTITGDGAVKLLRSLTEQQVKCGWIYIWSSHSLAAGQTQAIQNEAKTCVTREIEWNGEKIYSGDDDWDAKYGTALSSLKKSTLSTDRVKSSRSSKRSQAQSTSSGDLATLLSELRSSSNKTNLSADRVKSLRSRKRSQAQSASTGDLSTRLQVILSSSNESTLSKASRQSPRARKRSQAQCASEDDVIRPAKVSRRSRSGTASQGNRSADPLYQVTPPAVRRSSRRRVGTTSLSSGKTTRNATRKTISEPEVDGPQVGRRTGHGSQSLVSTTSKRSRRIAKN